MFNFSSFEPPDFDIFAFLHFHFFIFQIAYNFYCKIRIFLINMYMCENILIYEVKNWRITYEMEVEMMFFLMLQKF